MEKLRVDMKKHEKSGSKMTTVDFMLLGEFTLLRICTAQLGCIMVHPPKRTPAHRVCTGVRRCSLDDWMLGSTYPKDR